MSHAYCNQCRARVTVRNGLCLLDHAVDLDTLSTASGRRLKPGRRTRRRPPPSRPAPPTVAPPTTVVDLTSSRIASLATATGEARELAVNDSSPSSLVDVLVEPRPPQELEVDTPPLFDDPLLHDIAPTGDLIAELWGLEAAEASSTSWQASDVDEELVGSDRPRRHRWVVIGVGALAVGWMLGGYLSNGPDRSAQVAADTAALSEAVDRLRPLADDLTDGAFESPLELGELLSEVDRSARALFSSAAQLDEANAETAPLRIASSDLATLALTVETALADLAGYGSAVDRVTVPPELPTRVDTPALPDVTERLAAWVTARQDEIAMLPHNELTNTHRDTMVSFGNGLPGWQAVYLDALRKGDSTLAGTLIDGLEADLEALRSDWRTVASAGADWVSAQLDRLRQQAAAISPGS